MPKLTLVPPSSRMEQIRTIIIDCWGKQMEIPEACKVLLSKGITSQEIQEFQQWSMNNPCKDSELTPFRKD